MIESNSTEKKPTESQKAFRVLSVTSYFIVCCFCIYGSQAAVYPLHFMAPYAYDQFILLTKQWFVICLTSVSQWWAPIDMYVTEDESCKGTFSLKADGTLDSSRMNDRAIVISNHQLYTDWVYLWWFSYTAKVHEGIYIILKDSLKWLPILGWGMQNFKFIFLSRKWEKDQKILNDNLGRLNRGKDSPCWLILFPEGTTFSANALVKSRAYSEKTGTVHPKYLLLPRAKGFRHSLLRLDQTVEYVYDATFFYSGVPDGVFGEDYYTLHRVFIEGVFLRSAHVHWRRFKISDIPVEDEKEFDKWLLDRWYEKDELLQRFKDTGSFIPKDEDHKQASEPIKAHVRLYNPFEVLQIFGPATNFVLILFILWKFFI